MNDFNLAGLSSPARILDEYIDMAGVDPLRLAETRRRVAIVKAYVGLEAPTDGDRTHHAAALGLSVNQFLALVRSWREYGRASAISCAGAAKGMPRPNGPRNLPSESKKVAAQVLATLDSATPLIDAFRAITERCAAISTKAPSRNTIWNMMMAARRAGGHVGHEGVVVSRCHVKLPVEVEGQLIFPEITLAVDTLHGAVLVAGMEDPDGAAGAIIAAIGRMPPGAVPIVDAEVASAIAAHVDRRLRRVRPSAARTDTAKVLGRGFGTMNLLYQLSRSIEPADMLRSRRDAALAPYDARMLIAEQLMAHNAARGAEAPVFR